MNPSDWNQLVAGLMDGTLSANDHEQLKTLCREDPSKEEELVRAMLAERLLPLAVAPNAGEKTAEEVIFRIYPEIAEFPLALKRQPAWRRFPRVLLPAAAAIALGATGWFAFDHSRPNGYLSRTESLVWSGDPFPVDGKLGKGDQLNASSGLAEIQLRNGARLVLEAPFSVELTGYKSVTLNSGRLAARCPASAQGFTILTPRGKVVDLGTELGVHAGDDGSVEAHVLTGSVEIDSKSSPEKMSLFDGEAVRMDSDATSRIVADPTAFVTQMPLAESLPGFVHWNMDENHGNTAADTGHGLAGQNGSLTLAADSAAHPDAKPPEWINGVRGSGLAFDGIGSFAESTYRGIEGASPRTVALWIRVPETDIHAGTGILSWGSVAEDRAWQISINWSEKDGPVGRLRLGTFAGKIVGTTLLQDGNWHHIAVVMYPQPHPDAPANVLLYVDGKLEPISRRSTFRVDTNVRQAEHGVSLGRHVSPINDTRMFFHGEMDDVFIFGRPLLQESIRKLMDGRTETP
ncbi:MAG TPA: LamG-like jellyroll fold domain-containing protein [Luteolibacter sp.]|nr:LamG-like jellyroll fold domain-containing protein [Luteolibacter sp.]